MLGEPLEWNSLASEFPIPPAAQLDGRRGVSDALCKGIEMLDVTYPVINTLFLSLDMATGRGTGE
jgi:hypothetical protein